MLLKICVWLMLITPTLMHLIENFLILFCLSRETVKDTMMTEKGFGVGGVLIFFYQKKLLNI